MQLGGIADWAALGRGADEQHADCGWARGADGRRWVGGAAMRVGAQGPYACEWPCVWAGGQGGHACECRWLLAVGSLPFACTRAVTRRHSRSLGHPKSEGKQQPTPRVRIHPYKDMRRSSGWRKRAATWRTAAALASAAMGACPFIIDALWRSSEIWKLEPAFGK